MISHPTRPACFLLCCEILLLSLAHSVEAELVGYIANAESATISVLDVSENRVVDSISVDEDPIDLSASADGRTLIVVHGTSPKATLIDTRQGSIRAVVPLSADVPPSRVVTSPISLTAYIAHPLLEGPCNDGLCVLGSSISVLDLEKGVAGSDVYVDSDPGALDVSPSGLILAVITRQVAQQIVLLDSQTLSLVQSLHVPETPVDLRFSNSSQLYVAMNPSRGGESAMVAVVDPETSNFQPIISLPDLRIRQLVVNAETGQIYVLSVGLVTVIDPLTSAITAQVAIGRNPSAIEVLPSSVRAYVTDATENSVYVVDPIGGTNQPRITVGESPSAIVVVDVAEGNSTDSCALTPRPRSFVGSWLLTLVALALLARRKRLEGTAPGHP